MPGMEGRGVRTDPLVSAHFYVTVDPWLSGMVFRECSGIGSESDVVEDKETKQDDYHSLRVIPGRLKWQKITLKRGITGDSMSMWSWRRMVEEGKHNEARANGTIVMVNQNGEPVAEWEILRCWPSKISGPSLNSTQGTEVGIEEVELVHEGMKRLR